MGYLLRGVAAPESVTEHSWHVLFLVWALAPEIPDLDLARALEIALVHDLAEVRTGDLPRVAARYYAEGSKHAAERRVLDELTGPLSDRALPLHDEYQAAESTEARLVKACDKLQLMIKVAVYERWGEGGLSEFWDNPDNFPDFGFAAVGRLFDQLREAQAAWRQHRSQGSQRSTG